MDSYEIEIIPLARKKIEQRKISIEWVKDTISSPDEIMKGYGDREVRQKCYVIEGGKFLLRVICEKEKNKIVIITAYITSKIKKYGGKNENRI